MRNFFENLIYWPLNVLFGFLQVRWLVWELLALVAFFHFCHKFW
jgi:hypothetical protein